MNRLLIIFLIILSFSLRVAVAGPDVPAGDINRYAGVFEVGNGQHIYIQPWPGGEGKLLYTDDIGRVRALVQSSSSRKDATFTGGPGLLVTSPIELTITFIKNSQGLITRLQSQWRGSGSRTAKRLDSYTAENVVFKNGNLSLGGTLWRPPGKGPHSAIVLIHGSGQTDRNNVLPLAHFLVTHGVALFGYDKRGVGESTGDWHTASIQDLASDARSAVAFLRNQKGIDAKRIGVLGASHGGWVAPLVAIDPDSGVSFLISISGPSLSPATVEILRLRAMLKRNGISSDDAIKAEALLSAAFDVSRGTRAWKEFEPLIETEKSSRWFRLLSLPRAENSPLFDHWRSLPLDYDPRPTMKGLQIPVFAIFGALDQTVLPGPNALGWMKDLEDGGNRDFRVVTLPGANHMLLKASTGGDDEYRSLQLFVPDLAPAIIGWLRDHGVVK